MTRKSCELCGVTFGNHISLVLHYQDSHPAQELKCPGCNKGLTFIGDLISHLEENRCTKIHQSEWKMFQSEKKAEAQARDEPNFSRFMTTTEAGSTADWEAYAFQYDPAHFATAAPVSGFKEEDFPALPGKPKEEKKAVGPAIKLPLPMRTAKPAVQLVVEAPNPGSFNSRKKNHKKGANFHADNKENRQSLEKPAVKHQGAKKALKTPVKPAKELKEVEEAKDTKEKAVPAPIPNAWAQKKILFPNAAPVKRPTAEQLEIATAPNAKTAYLFTIHDPSHPHYDVEKYMAANGRYQCPMDNCIYAFETAEGMTHHLTYLGEHGGKKAECPSCGKRFKTASALAHHVQMVGDRCRMKDSSHYAQFVNEISSGLVEADGNNEVNTTKHSMTEEASSRFGKVQKPSKSQKQPEDLNADFNADLLEPGPAEDFW